MRILFVEDDRRISDFVMKGLAEASFNVTLCSSAEEARDMINGEWDLVLLDIMLPGMDGFQFIKLLRFKKNNTPILVLSALNDPMDKVAALDSGADDYLSKPFHFRELISRINALTRRAVLGTDRQERYTCADLTLDIDAHRVVRGEREVELSPREFKLLTYLLQHKNRVCGRTQILHAVWDINYDNTSNVVDVYISYLRNKIDSDGEIKLIHTVKGRGYMVRDE